MTLHIDTLYDLSRTIRVALKTELDDDSSYAAFPSGAVDYYATFEASWRRDGNARSEPEGRAVLQAALEVGATAQDEFLHIPIGSAHFVVVNLLDPDALEALDAREADLDHLAEAVCRLATNGQDTFADGLDALVDYVGGYAVLVNSVTVQPAFQGVTMGLRGTAMVLKELRRGCSFAALYPMAPGTRDEAEREAAAAGLAKYWSRLGFRPWRDGTMVLPFALRDFGEAAEEVGVRIVD